MKWFTNFKIAKKLIIAFIIVALIAGVVGLIGIINIIKIDENGNYLYEFETIPISQMSIIAASYQKVRVDSRSIILATSQADITDVKDNIQKYIDDINANAALFEKSIKTEELDTAYKDFLATRKAFVPYLNELIALAEQNKDEEANAMLAAGGDMAAAGLAEQDAIDELVQIKIAEAKELQDQNSATTRTATTTMIIIVCGSMVVAVLLGIGIARLISEPIKKLVAAADKIASGDLDVDIVAESKDEVGILAKAFKKMTDNFNEVMSTINVAAEQVSSGSAQVSISSVSLSQGATEQASSIEELSSVVQEIAVKTRQNAENANEANQLVETVRSNAIQGNVQMDEMLKSMQDINESSVSISKIIKVIDDIAFLTNILALNAAVEAARAGQHGKGFAVVAEEVRNLAARSANAAKETTELIEGSIKKVEAGTVIADHTALALKDIAVGIEKTAQIVESIASSSNEQAAGISQVNLGISQVSVVIQTNSATSEESAAASEELSSQADLLKIEVSKFKLKKKLRAEYDNINPEVLKMLEKYNDKKIEAEHRFAETDKQTISLGNEFSKY